MTDITATLKSKAKQLNADDLIGGAITIKITAANVNTKEEQPVALSYENDNGKPYKPCLSMRRVIAHVWGSDSANYAGRSLTVYRDPDVSYGGMKVGGIRISHASHIDGDKEVVLKANNKKHVKFIIKPIKTTEKPAAKKESAPVDKAKIAYDAIITELDAPQSDFDAVIAKHDKVIARFKEAYPDYYETIMSYKPEELPPVEAYADSIAASDEIDLF